MWLINTTTLELHEFVDARHAPRYAILSHCWGEGEISLKDFRKKRNCFGPGYEKIVECCKYAREVGYGNERLGWAWIDTCCIDKRSSAELSEAINSMFAWYEQAAICYAYLADVTADNEKLDTVNERPQKVTQSRWFTRGWTLQELLAPKEVVFLDADWYIIGSKQDQEVKNAIVSCTGIHFDALEQSHSQWNFSVAQRMSWASRRTTTRIEDEAYCLFGLFGIYLPLLYGEGQQAFHRLQHEILRQQLGDSLFVWHGGRAMPSIVRTFAVSPSAFVDAGSVIDTHEKSSALMTSTGNGVQLKIPAYLHDSVYCHASKDQLLVRLGCLRDKPSADGSSKLVRCFLHLTHHKSCGHFDTVRMDSISTNDAAPSRIFDEDDVVDPKSWRAVQATGSVYIHGSDNDAYLCATRRLGMDQAAAAPRLTLTRKQGAPNSYYVHNDARRFNIQ